MATGEYGTHLPVMLHQVLDLLITDDSGVYVDCTAGGGGHIEGLLNRLSEGRVIGIDQDAEAVAHCRQRFAGEKRVRILHGSFGNVRHLLAEAGIESVRGMLFDLGLSSHQIDTPRRGFSYIDSGPLDMRMDSQQLLTAKEIVNTYSEKDLADLFFLYGEERYARSIARGLAESRTDRLFETTADLAECIRSCTPARFQIKTLARIFQALRIAVNAEMKQLTDGFQGGYASLSAGGRMVVISYHSLEDRLTKRFFKGEPLDFKKREWAAVKTEYRFKRLTRRVMLPDEEDIQKNSRARSAKLRAAEKEGN